MGEAEVLTENGWVCYLCELEAEGGGEEIKEDAKIERGKKGKRIWCLVMEK